MIYFFRIIIFLLFIISPSLYSQSLKDTSYTDLKRYLDQEHTDTITTKEYAKAFLFKAKEENNAIRLGQAYTYLTSIYSHSEKGILYADSIIKVTKDVKTKFYPAEGYIEKGIQLYYNSYYKKALSNFIEANELAVSEKNIHQQTVVKHYIALLKNINKEYSEALKIFEDNLQFIEENGYDTLYRKQHLKSIFALADSYNKNEKLEDARKYLKKGLNISNDKGKPSFLYSHFLNSYGINSFFRKDYLKAIDSLKKASGYIKNKPNTLAANYLFLYLSYRDNNKPNDGLEYLLKIDSIYSKNESIIFYAKEAYNHLNIFYRDIEDPQNQLEYLNKLFKTDSLIVEKHGDLGSEIVRSYEIPKLINEKQTIINKLTKKDKFNNNKIIVLFIIVILLIILGVLLIRRNYIFKKRYNTFVENRVVSQKLNEDVDHQNKLSKGVTDILLKQIESFEMSGNVIKKHYTLNSLAKELKTNSAYLSKFINTNKKVNFSTYLNNLKIDCAIELLHQDKKLRSYTIKAIAEELKFNNVQSFTNAFKKKTGLQPSYYIKQIQNKE